MLADVPAPLYYASLLGLIEIVSRLIGFGADVNTQGGYYGKPIQTASVELLLDTGWAIPILTMKSMARLPLSFGAERDHIAILEKLLRTDSVDPDSKTKESWSKGSTPLSYDTEGRHQKE
ncbi:hypothetical protein OIDMADRAFT_56622 [Oidiodendron maius Zn]|uniref:Uncharacterized protein n=1 Tax=Oidiodendron maius (strain Zn) TaxID=913774 RepID=A0A0C3D8K4_OIDMZ|nr:hypothetical protein OIDMADRAFT_56622 [Oidiodendron maius Zn]